MSAGRSSTYNWLDTDGLAALLPRMLPDILARPHGWAFALIRGYYSGHCIAHMEWNGIPLDVETYRRLDRHWDGIRARLVAQYNPEFGVYDGLRFVTERFVEYLVREDIPWPEQASGVPGSARQDVRGHGRGISPDRTVAPAPKNPVQVAPQLDHAWRRRAQPRPSGPVRRFDRAQCSRGRQAHLRAEPLAARVDQADPRKRARATLTGARRNSSIAAALSGDQHMLAAIASGDPYMWFAKMARLAPEWATAQLTKIFARSASAAAWACCTAWATARWRCASGDRSSRPESCSSTTGRLFPDVLGLVRPRGAHEATWDGYIDLSFGWRMHHGTRRGRAGHRPTHPDERPRCKGTVPRCCGWPRSSVTGPGSPSTPRCTTPS